MSRLPYFDAVRMSILDPMHNILLGKPAFSDLPLEDLTSLWLGICKSQWLDSWIRDKVLRQRTAGQRPRELDQIQAYLSKVSTVRSLIRFLDRLAQSFSSRCHHGSAAFQIRSAILQEGLYPQMNTRHSSWCTVL